MTWKLQTINGEFTGTEITIERDMLVGRHQEANIVLAVAEISRRHAAFLLKEQALYVQDLKSSNGTFVNDLRVENEALLKDGDIVQFASLKFSVLAPAVIQAEAVKPEVIVQPAEAVATSEISIAQVDLTNQAESTEAIKVKEQNNTSTVEDVIAEPVVVEKTVAEKMNDQGMPDLKERDANVKLSPEGMPQNVGIPKPAPIPADVDLNAKPIRHEECEVDIPVTCVEQEKETQKNATIGLMALLAIIFVAVIAWFIFN
ncbi:MAG: FHA domain-containing protein [Acinetobacter sp.]|nr:FHA domain-containing protein [Acinetobacter sp.]MBP8206233.1 FHA domain-containing protein [Acinetobacter sp.]